MSVRAPRGTTLSCKGWAQEAALRLLMNSLDPEVAEDPENLIVCGGTGKAARSWPCFEAIVRTLRGLEGDETLLVQSGKPVGVFRTHEMAPRVLLSNSMLVPAWATWDRFRELERAGLTVSGQMSAGSWTYTGTQDILQGTYETLGELARQHFGGTLAGRLVLTAGLGGMGGAQPLAVTMHDGVTLVAEVNPQRAARRQEDGYLDVVAGSLDQALVRCAAAVSEKRPLSVAVVDNAATVYAELVRRGLHVDVVTDQTSAHDLLRGYIPEGLSGEAAAELRERDPRDYEARALATAARHVQAMLDFQAAGAIVFDYGNNLREAARRGGVERAYDIVGFVPAFLRPLLCAGRAPFRWVALSGDPADIARTDRAVLETFPHDLALARWIDQAARHVKFQGLPARICWLGYQERAELGQAFNRLVWEGEISAPLAIGRDPLDCGSASSPHCESEAMRDGSDAIGDWPILNALLNTACGASWVSLTQGSGVGIGDSLHAGMVAVADGSSEAEERLARVLTSDPGMGRHPLRRCGLPRSGRAGPPARRPRADAVVRSSGAIPSQIIEQFLDSGAIEAEIPVPGGNVQPSSLDLRLGRRAFRVKAAFLPREGEAIEEALQRYGVEQLDLGEGARLELHQTYLVELMERVRLPREVHAYTNNKSSSGRLNIWVRTLVDGLPRFDRIPEGYAGKLYAMITPRSWPVRVQAGLTLNQARFLVGDNRLLDLELDMVHQKTGLVFNAAGQPIPPSLDKGILLTADLSLPTVGYRAIGPDLLVDMTSEQTHPAERYFEPLRADGGELLLRKGEFYIMSTCEHLRVPPSYAVEMVAYDIHSGEFRSHYAGFFDPGFGYGRSGEVLGTPAVLEVDPHEDVIMRHGQPICKMVYEPLLKDPERIYGADLLSHYAHQRGPQLGRHFAPFPILLKT